MSHSGTTCGIAPLAMRESDGIASVDAVKGAPGPRQDVGHRRSYPASATHQTPEGPGVHRPWVAPDLRAGRHAPSAPGPRPPATPEALARVPREHSSSQMDDKIERITALVGLHAPPQVIPSVPTRVVGSIPSCRQVGCDRWQRTL